MNAINNFEILFSKWQLGPGMNCRTSYFYMQSEIRMWCVKYCGISYALGTNARSTYLNHSELYIHYEICKIRTSTYVLTICTLFL